MPRFILVAMLFPTAVIAADEVYTISVSGTIRPQGRSSIGIPLLLYVGTSQGKCSGQPQAVTDPNGKFSFVHTVQRAWQEQFAVSLRTFRLCTRESEAWTELWSFRTGPPPKQLGFDCPSPASRQNPCRVEWNGRVLPNVQPNRAFENGRSQASLRSLAHAVQRER
jgi:hypothetical protein